MRHRTLLLLLAALAVSACTDSRGRLDPGRTALLGAGVGVAAALLVAGDSSSNRHGSGYGNQGTRSAGYNGGYGYGNSGYRNPGYGYGK